jgi:hypothetical protein
MKTKLTFLFMSIILIASLGMYLIPSPPSPTAVDLKVLSIDGVWKVVYASDYKKYEVKVARGDTISWTTKGTDVSFQFPDFLFEPVGAKDSLSNGYTKSIKDGSTLTLVVRKDVSPGTYEYAVFCKTDGVFARGGSPPKIIVE